MFRILKNLIKGREKEPETIAFSVFDQWFTNRLKETTLRDELNDVFDAIAITTKGMQQNLTKISTVMVQLPDEQRAVVEEHAQKYVSMMTHLVRQLTYRESRDFAAILNYHETLCAAIEEMKTSKEASVIMKFYPEQAGALQECVDELSESQSELQDIIKREHGLEFIAGIKHMIQQIEKKQKKKMELQSLIEREDAKKQDAEKYRLKLETDADELKTSAEFDKYDKMLSRKIYLETEKKRVQSSVESIFGQLVPLFRLYDQRELGADRALARTYAEDYERAFFNDQQLWVLSLLESISAKLPELESDEKKRMKYRQSIIAITAESLKQLIAKSGGLDDGLREIRHQMSNDVTARKLEDIKYKINHAEQQIRHFDDTMAQHRKDIDGLAIEKDLRTLEKDTGTFTKVKLV